MVRNAMIVILCSLLTFEAVFPDVSLADLSRLPELVHHYYQHKKQSPDIGFAAFLSLHYCDSRHLASAPADHGKLPFSKRQHHRVLLQIPHEPVVYNTQPIYRIICVVKETHAPVFLAREIASQVWQPPRA